MLSINTNPRICSSDKLLSSGRRQHNGMYNINTSILRYSIKNVQYSYKYNIMDIIDSMILTYSWLKFSDMLLFTVCVTICILTLLSSYSIQTAQVPVPCIDVPCVGSDLILLERKLRY